MAVQLNKKSEKFAMELINVGDISNAAWSFSAADGNAILGDDEDWAAYADYHLAQDTEFDDDTKARYKYPFGKAGKVYVAALRAIRSRAAQQDLTTIFDAAGRLLDAANEKLERADVKKLEVRSHKNVRVTSEDEGIVEAYLTAWDTVDSYKSTFKRGAFKKTFEERGDKIRLLWNHEELAGKIIEAKEDDYGPFVRAQFNLDTRSGKEAFAHVKEKDVDSFSFGFNVINDGWAGGIREITEVRCMECGPVIFEANSAAKIVDVRAEDFDQTVYEQGLRERGWKLRWALNETLDDIMWGNNAVDQIVGKIDEAISAFHGRFLEWVQELNGYESGTIRSISSENDLAYQTRATLGDDATSTTALTEEDVKCLRSGKLLAKESRNKLADLPEGIREAHRVERRKAVETLCDEFREGGYSDAEKMRFTSLLRMSEGPDEISSAINFLENFRNELR